MMQFIRGHELELADHALLVRGEVPTECDVGIRVAVLAVQQRLAHA